MNTKEIMEKRHALLESLNEEMKAAEIAAVIRQEEGAPEMVSAMLDELGDGDTEIVGDFFFRPLETEEDEVQYFSVMITITDEIPGERLTALYEAPLFLLCLKCPAAHRHGGRGSSRGDESCSGKCPGHRRRVSRDSDGRVKRQRGCRRGRTVPGGTGRVNRETVLLIGIKK